MKKAVFVDRHERPDVVEDRTNFLKLIKDMEPYLIEFNTNGTMKDKAYPPGCAVNSDNRRSVIVITHDECTLSANDGIQKAWTQIEETFLRAKGRGQSIMTSDFLLAFGHLNLFLLSEEKRKEVIEKSELTIIEAVELFEYGKANKGYWDGPKLHKQVVNKALSLAEALYPSYSLLFLFDNATSHSVYAQDALRKAQMNKSSGGKQPWLRNGWYDQDGCKFIQSMSFQNTSGTWVQKGVQRILEERKLWLIGGLNLECAKSKCFNYEVASSCKVCI